MPDQGGSGGRDSSRRGSRGPDITAGHPSARVRALPDPDPATPPRLAAEFPAEASPPPGVVVHGPDIPDERTLHLLGHVQGKRVLELGGGAGHNAVALAQQGAHVIVVEPSPRRLERVRHHCDEHGVRAELHQSDLADLAFVRADTVDLALSVFALASVPDLDRVFRQVHRVLRAEAPFVFSLPHPAFGLAQGGTYFDDLARPWETDDARGNEVPRTIGEIVSGLARANFRLDALLEPEPVAAPRSPFWTDAMARAPATLVVRARKEGF